ncbi:MAG: hypothetical protein WC712_04035 [Candidatus Brocadiia bacterium]
MAVTYGLRPTVNSPFFKDKNGAVEPSDVGVGFADAEEVEDLYASIGAELQESCGFQREQRFAEHSDADSAAFGGNCGVELGEAGCGDAGAAEFDAMLLQDEVHPEGCVVEARDGFGSHKGGVEVNGHDCSLWALYICGDFGRMALGWRRMANGENGLPELGGANSERVQGKGGLEEDTGRNIGWEKKLGEAMDFLSANERE